MTMTTFLSILIPPNALTLTPVDTSRTV